jgi:hypothetical protein
MLDDGRIASDLRVADVQGDLRADLLAKLGVG